MLMGWLTLAEVLVSLLEFIKFLVFTQSALSMGDSHLWLSKVWVSLLLVLISDHS